ncbi:hypothetical protein [Luteolibacter marinus]|uniref:hypothetical protein n=1 Tax=Luteolibacter marinus TaxID=2776705 RepID=UPI0018680777|nr:hypothetical protein [Luteolibacter marinus]
METELDRIEHAIEARSNLHESLKSLRSISARVNELTDRLLNLYDFPDLEPEGADEDDPFDWPSTAVLPAHDALGANHFEYTSGVLSFLGYSVGKSGLLAGPRRAILRYVYLKRLPAVSSAEYMAEWGRAETGNRLCKLANSIASFARNAKRRNAKLSKAISDWKSDLAWLKKEYYDGNYDGEFSWPRPY